MNLRKLKNISKIIILLLLFLAVSPLFKIQIHHGIQNSIEIVNNFHHNGNCCGKHKNHGCQDESFLEHLFENGAQIVIIGIFISDQEIKYLDEPINVNNSLPLSLSYITNRIYHDNHYLPDFLITAATNPRSPPAHS